MTNSKSTKRALLLSALSILMCVAMLVGTTFAWFTDTASTAVNKIQAGTLDVALEMFNGEKWVPAENTTLDFVKAAGHTNEAILWEPGCTYNLPELRIVNKGNLALKYKVVISGINGDAKLNEAIDWTIGDVAMGTEQHLAASEFSSFTISGHMKETAGNEYQGLTIDGIAITVYATQDTVEYDSNNNLYDAGATLPSFWDGKTVTNPTKNDADGKYHITSAAEFVAFVSGDFKINAGNTVVLDRDIDLAGATVKGYANSVFDSDFDGQGHTVSNFTVTTTYFDNEHYCGLFPYIYAGKSVKNLTVKDAVAIAPDGVGMVGMITGAAYDNTVVENCHVINCTVIGEKKVGAVAGYTNGTVKDCSATDCAVFCKVSEAEESGSKNHQAGEIVGYIDVAGSVADCIHNNVAVKFSATPVANGVVATGNNDYDIYNANGMFWFAGLSADEQYNKNITLAADIDLGNKPWTPICNSQTQYSGTFDGNGHTISGLKINDHDKSGNEATGLFAWTNGTIKNLTIDGAEVIGNHWVGAIVGYAQAGTVENCTVKNATVTAIYKDKDRDGDKAAAVVGYLNKGDFAPMVKNCEAENCVITAVRDAGQIVGAAKEERVTDCTATNVTVSGEGDNIRNEVIGRLITD